MAKKIILTLLFVIFYSNVSANEGNTIDKKDGIISEDPGFFSGFSIRPGIGTSFVDVWITRRSDNYEAMLTTSKDSIGSPYLSFTATSPEYYFYEKKYVSPTEIPMLAKLGVGLRAKTHTFKLSYQTLAQNDNFEPESVDTSISGTMAYLSAMMLFRFEIQGNKINRLSNTSIMTGIGYARGVIELNGNAIFGLGRNTSGITAKDDVSLSSTSASGFVFVIEGSGATGSTGGLEIGSMKFSNSQYSYNVTGAKFYYSYIFSI